jgi:hypothetical protein
VTVDAIVALTVGCGGLTVFSFTAGYVLGETRATKRDADRWRAFNQRNARWP